jgi:hypothetical protein
MKFANMFFKSLADTASYARLGNPFLAETILAPTQKNVLNGGDGL